MAHSETGVVTSQPGAGETVSLPEGGPPSQAGVDRNTALLAARREPGKPVERTEGEKSSPRGYRKRGWVL
jgi:hypothetical protein